MTGHGTGTPQITVDDTSGVAPFEQVRDQFADLIATGALAEGDRLPTVRGLAGELQLAAGTVARAYKELEAQGLVTTRSRAGTVVAPHTQSVDIALRRSASELAAAGRRRRTGRRRGARDPGRGAARGATLSTVGRNGDLVLEFAAYNLYAFRVLDGSELLLASGEGPIVRSPSSSGPGPRPFTAVARVRIPLGIRITSTI